MSFLIWQAKTGTICSFLQNSLFQRCFAACFESVIRWLRASGWCRRSAQEPSLSLQHFRLCAAISASRKKCSHWFLSRTLALVFAFRFTLFYASFRPLLLVSWAFAEEWWYFEVRDMAFVEQRKCRKSPLEEWKHQTAMHRLECQGICISGSHLVIFLPHKISDITQKRLPVGNLILWERGWVSD